MSDLLRGAIRAPEPGSCLPAACDVPPGSLDRPSVERGPDTPLAPLPTIAPRGAPRPGTAPVSVYRDRGRGRDRARGRDRDRARDWDGDRARARSRPASGAGLHTGLDPGTATDADTDPTTDPATDPVPVPDPDTDPDSDTDTGPDTVPATYPVPAAGRGPACPGHPGREDGLSAPWCSAPLRPGRRWADGAARTPPGALGCPGAPLRAGGVSGGRRTSSRLRGPGSAGRSPGEGGDRWHGG